MGIYAHASRLSQLQFLIPEEKFKEFLNSLDETKKKAIFLNAPKYLLSHMSKEIIDETLNAILNENDNPEEFTSYFIDALVNNPDNLSLEQARKFSKILYNYDKKLKPSERASYERNYYEAMKLLRKKSIEVSDQEFAALPIQDKRTLVKYFNVDRFIETAMDEIQGDNVLIKPLDKVDEERMVQILKYNNIELPRQPIIKEKDTLSEILAKKLDVTPIEDLHVNLDELSKEELERMSVEYDSFNRYAHGRLAIRFLKSFSVSLPIQEDGFKNWLKKMEDEGLDPKIMKPVFHGTGSIGASMILRYGFKIIKSNDPAVVGRMLGDGIYFSNVIDKVAQYVSDNGYGRARGTQGYIFEMEASLGKHKRDYRCAGTGTREDEKSGIISPEWAVFSPNEQLRIYKAYLVELIDKKDMKDMKKKYLGIEESSVVEIKSFKQFINEGAGDMEHCITYIFMDGTIPVSEKERVEFEKFSASRFGKNVKLDWTGSGPAVLIYNNKESRTFVVRYTKDFMKDNVELTRYLRLVGAK